MPLMLAGPLAKFLGILVLILAVFGAGEWHGRHAVQQAWDAAIAQQALKAAASVITQAENTAKVVVKYVKIKGDTRHITETIEKEVIRYVNLPGEKCQLSPEFVSTFDRISGVLDRHSDRLPPSPGPTGGTAESTGPPLEDTVVLRAHGDAVEQLRDLWTAYAALVEWVRSSYELQRAGSGRPVTITE